MRFFCKKKAWKRYSTTCWSSTRIKLEIPLLSAHFVILFMYIQHYFEHLIFKTKLAIVARVPVFISSLLFVLHKIWANISTRYYLLS